MAKPTALIITRNLPPRVGGMERLIWHIVDELRPDYHIHVIGPTGSATLLPKDVTMTEIPIESFIIYLFKSLIAVIKQSIRLRPQLAFAGSGLTAPLAWLSSRISAKICIVYLHGLDVEVNHPIYRFGWLPFIRRCNRVLANSHFTQQLAINAGVPAEKISIIHPGVTLPDLDSAVTQRQCFRTRHNLIGKPLMLYVGRMTARKGLAAFIEKGLPTIIEKFPDAKLIVIGEEPTSALLKPGGERMRIANALKATQLQHCVEFLGELEREDPELDAAYFAADVSIFPVRYRPNDNEGFGMVAIEAAAHGLPTVAYNVGGVSDAIKNGVSGILITPEQYIDFARAVCNYLEEAPYRQNKQLECIHNFAKKFTWSTFGEQVRSLCSK